MITVTDAAKEWFKKVVESKQAKGIRVGVKSSGCAGLSYDIDVEFESHFNDPDWHSLDCGVIVYIHESSRPFIEGMTLDWKSDGINQRVVFENPNERVNSRCGCGESFSV